MSDRSNPIELPAPSAMKEINTFLFDGTKTSGHFLQKICIVVYEMIGITYIKHFSVDHFYNKLFKLKDTMNTKAAQKEAQIRTEYMKGFLTQLQCEIGI